MSGHLCMSVVLCACCSHVIGADPTHMQTGHTPLHEASAQGQTRMALLLLSLGGDVTQADKVGVGVGVDCTGSGSGMWEWQWVWIVLAVGVTCGSGSGCGLYWQWEWQWVWIVLAVGVACGSGSGCGLDKQQVLHVVVALGHLMG